MRDIQNKTSLIIFSLNTDSAFNEYRLIEACGLNYIKEVRGSYKGETEVSHIVEFNGLYDLQKVLSLAGEYDQESILVLDVDRNAELHTIGGGIEPLGRFVNVTAGEALRCDAWTHDLERDLYYICR